VTQRAANSGWNREFPLRRLRGDAKKPKSLNDAPKDLGFLREFRVIRGEVSRSFPTTKALARFRVNSRFFKGLKIQPRMTRRPAGDTETNKTAVGTANFRYAAPRRRKETKNLEWHPKDSGFLRAFLCHPWLNQQFLPNHESLGAFSRKFVVLPGLNSTTDCTAPSGRHGDQQTAVGTANFRYAACAATQRNQSQNLWGAVHGFGFLRVAPCNPWFDQL